MPVFFAIMRIGVFFPLRESSLSTIRKLNGFGRRSDTYIRGSMCVPVRKRMSEDKLFAIEFDPMAFVEVN